MSKQYELVITLKSDLCAGSGYSYAKLIDSDVNYTNAGIPYIPARRIKGCLREAANLIGENSIEELFGCGGKEKVQGVYIGNAYLSKVGKEKEMAEMNDVLEQIQNSSNKSQKEYLNSQNVLRQFTSLKTQTKVDRETGVADDTSLRVTRMVNHYSPFESEGELQFIASVSFSDKEKEDAWFESLKRITKALRNMGLNRNRGLGSVTCELVYKEILDEELKNMRSKYAITVSGSETIQDEKQYKLDYYITNSAPLMLSGNNDAKTETYISGQMVIGFLAGAYQRDGGDVNSKEFANLFLKNQVTYSALYPYVLADDAVSKDTDGKECVDYDKGITFYPAPAYINRLKKSDQLINVTRWNPEEDAQQSVDNWEYGTKNGNQAKRLIGKFVGRKDKDTYLVMEMPTEVVYHHSRPNEKDKNGQLYAMTAIQPGQLFHGTITGSGEHIKVLKACLENETIRFGKSRSAQYGTCKLLGGKITPVSNEIQSGSYETGQEILVVLQSDGIFTNDYGYVVDCNSVKEKIISTLGIVQQEEEKNDLCENQTSTFASIEVKELTGYYSVWNLKRPAISAVAAGTTFAFKVDAETANKLVGPIHYVGERTGEGYGRVEVILNPKYAASGEQDKNPSYALKGDKLPQSKPVEIQNEYVKQLYQNIMIEKAKEELDKQALSKSDEVAKRLNTTRSLLGRVTLMLQESIQETDDAKERNIALWKRVNSIKRDKEKEKVKTVLQSCIGSEITEQSDNSFLNQYNQVVDGLSQKKEYDTLVEPGKFQEKMQEYWSTYLLAILTCIKYEWREQDIVGNTEGDETDE